MAKTQDKLKSITENSAYDSLEGVVVLKSGEYAKWEDNHLEQIPIYKLERLTTEQCVKYGDYMVRCMTTGTNINTDLVNIVLHLAVSIRNPEEKKSFLLKGPKVSTKSTRIQYDIPEVTSLYETSDAEEEKLLEELQELIPGTSKGNMTRNIVEKKDGIPTEEEPIIGKESDRGDLVMEACGASYIAAYLLRLQSRSAQNASSGLKRAIDRFASWYDDRMGILNDVEISLEAMNALKESISRKPEVTSTWVMWLAITENEVPLLQQSQGMLEYLGFQVYAYQGMHAYTQVMAIHQISSMSLKELLKELDCPLTRQGLTEVVKIVNDHETTLAMGRRPTYFRYARVWNKKYFAPLQSKACVPLLYVAAMTVKGISPNTLSDPTKIMALQNLGENLKRALDNVANALSEMILKKTLSDEKSGTIWDHAVSEEDAPEI